LETAKSLASKINSGSLPFSLIVKNSNIISPTLGSGALAVMVRAGIAAFIVVCLFMLFYYRLPGFVACIALTLQVVGQLLALSIPQFTLTLPGIAGVILSIGMGVDANVIVSERIKEEINTGKTLVSAIDSGFHRAFSSVFDGNITVIIVAIMLILVGSGSMLSFGYTLLWGVIMNFVCGVTASRLMIQSLSEYKLLRKPALYGARRLAQ
jgi:protein-export membrane protein SecD